MTPPTVSVLMSVYNGERTLREAVDSILGQTFGDFEFVIVDDGSTDGTAALLDAYTDPRIVRLRNTANIGLTRALNRGLEATRGKYIARMDADDVSLPGRLKMQVDYMERHPAVALLGMNVALYEQPDRPLYMLAGTPGYLRWKLLWDNPLPHATVMLRRSVLEKTGIRYDPQFQLAQDYDLWAWLAEHGAVVRLPEVGLLRRVPPTSLSVAQREAQVSAHYQVMRRQLKAILGDGADVQSGIDAFYAVLFSSHAPPSCDGCDGRRGPIPLDPRKEQEPDSEAAGAMLARVYRHFVRLDLPDAEMEQIGAEFVYYLLKVVRAAGGVRGAKVLLRALWQARSLLLARVIVKKLAHRRRFSLEAEPVTST